MTLFLRVSPIREVQNCLTASKTQILLELSNEENLFLQHFSKANLAAVEGKIFNMLYDTDNGIPVCKIS